jgi:hypothetical protein
VVVMETGELSSFELLRDQCIVVQLGSLNAMLCTSFSTKPEGYSTYTKKNRNPTPGPTTI